LAILPLLVCGSASRTAQAGAFEAGQPAAHMAHKLVGGTGAAGTTTAQTPRPLVTGTPTTAT
jgi:hypothetical protein